MMQYSIASIGAAGRYKDRTKKKDRALAKITFGANFQDLPAEGLWALAQWGAEFKAGYKETVCAGLELMEEEMREEVTDSMNDDTVAKAKPMQVHGDDEYFSSSGRLKTNQFLHRPNKKAAQRYASGWIRQGDSQDMWGDCHAEESDDQLFLPESKVELAVQALNNSSLTGNVSSYSGSKIFPKIQRQDLDCPPDEQRWRSFLYAVTKATGQYRQVARVRN